MAQSLTKEVQVGNLVLTVYALKFLAAKLHRKPSAIKIWEWRKIIPKPLIHTKDGCRWYTKEEVDMYTRLAEEEQIKNGKGFARTKFSQRVFGETAILQKKLDAEIAKTERLS